MYQLWDMIDDEVWFESLRYERILDELARYEENYCKDIGETSKHLDKNGKILDGSLQEVLDLGNFAIILV